MVEMIQVPEGRPSSHAHSLGAGGESSGADENAGVLRSALSSSPCTFILGGRYAVFGCGNTLWPTLIHSVDLPFGDSDCADSARASRRSPSCSKSRTGGGRSSSSAPRGTARARCHRKRVGEPG